MNNKNLVNNNLVKVAKILPVLILSAGFFMSNIKCDNYGMDKNVKECQRNGGSGRAEVGRSKVARQAEVAQPVEIMKPEIDGGQKIIGPRWTYGIMVKNGSDNEVWVRADGGTANGYEVIAAGDEKLIKTSAPRPIGVYWKIKGDADYVYETKKYGRPDYMEIKNGNIYDMTSMDGTKDMGSWTALEPVTYSDQRAEARKVK